MNTISVQVTGLDKVVAHLQVDEPARVRAAVAAEVQALGFTLERRVKLEKLMGQVLHRRTGQLARGINTIFVQLAPDVFQSSTGTTVFQGRLWELTGHRAFTVFPVQKKALFWKGAAHPVKRVDIPAEQPRPFLRPTLQEMRPEIERRLRVAVGLAVE